MHLDGRTRQRLGLATNRLSRWLAVLFPVSLAGSVFGQGYLVPPQGFQGAPAVPAMGNVTDKSGPSNGQVTSRTIEMVNEKAEGEPKPEANPEKNGETTPPVNGEAPATSTPPLTAPIDSILNWGALHAHLRASYQFLYASGVHSAPGNSEDTITHTLSPGISLNLGPHVTFDYAPSIRFFTQKDFHNTVDHSLSLSGGVHYGDWTLGISQDFVVADEPLVETSGQTQTMDYSGGLVAAYQFNEKLSLTTTAGVGLVFVGSTNSVATNGVGGSTALSDSQSFSAAEWLSYAFSEKISAGVGGNVGYSEQSGGFRSIDENYNLRMGWHPGNKLSASLSGGIARQHYLQSNGGTSKWKPVYSATVGYQLFETTSFSLSADRSIGSSLFQNQIVESTTLGVGVQQRLLGKVQMSLGFGYTKSDYKLTTGNLTTTRSDEGFSYSAGMAVPFLKRFNFGTFYQYTQNTSSAGGFGFSSSQLGATLSWAY
jgi:hypothetical protein